MSTSAGGKGTGGAAQASTTTGNRSGANAGGAVADSTATSDTGRAKGGSGGKGTGGNSANVGVTSSATGGTHDAAGGVSSGNNTTSRARGGSNTTSGASSQAGGASSSTGGTSVGVGGSAAVGGSASSAAVQCPATATAKPGEATVSITVGTMTRSFIRHVPPGYTGKTPMPVVIDFHGKGGSASSWKDSTGWATLADQKGFIMIWPDGYQNSWHVGRCCGAADEQNIEDVAFTRAIITSIAKDACIDAKRVYATGCSNGGGMAFKVACDLADLVAAVAPVDFDCAYSEDNTGATPSCGGCAPTRPISEIQFRGTADAMAIYEGGIRDGGTNYHSGALQNFAEWGEINQCTGKAAVLPEHAACQAYPQCGGGVDTVLCTVQNGTHCGSYDSFGIVNIAWELLQRHALP